MPARLSPYADQTRSIVGRNTPTEDDPTRKPHEPATERIRLQIQNVIQDRLSAIHCVVSDVSTAELQYRLLGAKRYWCRHVKQEKSGAKHWEARCFEVSLRRSTLEYIKSVTSWHQISRLPPDDVQLSSLGFFESEKQASQAYDAAFKARDNQSPLRVGGVAAGKPSSRGHQREPMPSALATRFQAVVVSDCFARCPQRRRLEFVYESLLEVFSEPPSTPPCSAYSAGMSSIRGFAVVGPVVVSLPIFRQLPFHLTVIAKTSAQGKLLSVAKRGLADTERFGPSHLQNDRSLVVDGSVLPMSRGLIDLVASSSNQHETKLPHFYHGLPDELKRMVAEEQDKMNALIVQNSSGASKAFLKLAKNTEAGFMQKYLKQRRELVVAAKRIQRLLRRNMQSKSLRYIVRRHRAAIYLQRLFRGHCERVFVRAYREVMVSASTIVQAVYRSHVSRERTKQLQVAMHKAASDIQRVYRGHVGRVFAHWVRHKEASAVTIERVVRGFMSRRRVHCLKLAKLKKTILIPAAKTIQRVWRGVVARQLAREKRQIQHRLRVLDPAALRIERVLRGFLARRTARKFRLAWHSACVIQKHWRSHRYYGKWMALMEFRRRDKMASKIGALGRGYVARQFFKREKRRLHLQFVLHPTAVRIQRVFRGHVIRRQNEDIRDRVEAAITLQQMWRKRSRIKTIQARLRGFLTAIRHASATKIQFWYRCCKARELLAFLKAMQRARHGKAALVIQCAWRSHCSRVQLREFRLCSRIERKALALTKWKDDREDIEFDIEDARGDLKRTIKYKAKSLRRIKELKEMRIEWERRQPVVEKELSELTQEDIDRGWGEAFETEKHVLRFQLELSVEDILAHKEQIRQYEAEIEDLRLELEDLERDLEECIMDETMELEAYRDMELQQAHRMVAQDMAWKIRLQKERWGVRNVRKNVILRAREDVQVVENELLAQRQVQELGVLGFEKKLLLKEKIEKAIERVVHDRAKQSEFIMEMRRDAKVVAGFNDAIEHMSTITSQYSLDYRLPKHDMRELEQTPMCEGCGRITCDCDELEAKRLLMAAASSGKMSLDLKRSPKISVAQSGTNYGHPLRRKRNYEPL